MKEHTSLELSRRLHDKGYRGEHTSVWVDDCFFTQEEFKHICGEPPIAAYTFTELWGHLSKNQRYDFALTIIAESLEERDDITEALGEWLIDEGHYLIKKEG